MHPLNTLVRSQKQGKPVGICSACSANELVIEACMDRAKADGDFVLIEATANQVNQDGGYTGMKPQDFRDYVDRIADFVGFPQEKIILGGDHLGPLTWSTLPAEQAMAKARELVLEYVLAGFTKIHIDTSMRLGDDDPSSPLPTATIAERGADLGKVAEDAYARLLQEQPLAVAPVYVVGSEVPIPGGSQEEEEGIQVTSAEDFQETVELFRSAFLRLGLDKAWDHVVAVVVQPGVEFGDDSIHPYDAAAAAELTAALKDYPSIVFEGHSTDYQQPEALRQMVEDGIAILKVGPALTFALREALFALAFIEAELFADSTDVDTSRFIEVLEAEMLANPAHWQKHYHGSEEKLRLARKYSYSDRGRYYLPLPSVQKSMAAMFANLSAVEIPDTVLRQFMPLQYTQVRSGRLRKEPRELVKSRVIDCIEEYLVGTGRLADF